MPKIIYDYNYCPIRYKFMLSWALFLSTGQKSLKQKRGPTFYVLLYSMAKQLFSEMFQLPTISPFTAPLPLSRLVDQNQLTTDPNYYKNGILAVYVHLSVHFLDMLQNSAQIVVVKMSKKENEKIKNRKILFLEKSVERALMTITTGII